MNSNGCVLNVYSNPELAALDLAEATDYAVALRYEYRILAGEVDSPRSP